LGCESGEGCREARTRYPFVSPMGYMPLKVMDQGGTVQPPNVVINEVSPGFRDPTHPVNY
jgi:hypothetical protein